MDIKFKKRAFHFSPTVLLVTFIVVGTCLSLSYWQVQRASIKQYKLNYLNEKAKQGAISLKQAINLPKNVDKTGVLVSFVANVDKQRYWLLDNRMLNGQVGYDLLVLAQVLDINKKLLVNLGWIPAPTLRSELPLVQLPQQVTLSKAILKEGDLAGFYLSSEVEINLRWPRRIQYIDLAQLELSAATRLLPFMVYAQDALIGATPHYQAVVMSPQKHYAYALQWALIGFCAFIIIIYASRKREVQ